MVYIIIILLIMGGDLFIKNYIEKNKVFGKEETILKGNIIVTKYHNKGAILNFLEKKPNIVKSISALFLGGMLLLLGYLLPSKNNKLLKLSIALIIGGGFSNVYDRFTKGYVVDYFSFKWLKKVVFNISDICIIVGAVLMNIAVLIKKNK